MLNPMGTVERRQPRTSMREWLTLRLAVALLLVSSGSTAHEATPTHGDPAARLSPASGATEYWDVTAHFDGAYRLFARFVITNEGPGKQTAAAMGYVVHPDGHFSEFKNGRQKGGWKLSPDHLRIDVASSSLDLRAPVHQLAIDSNKQGVKIDLQFPASETPVSLPGPSTPAFHTDTLQISAPMEGTIWVRGMPAPVRVHGTTALTHAWMDESESKLVQRRIEFVAATPTLALYLSDITTPAGAHHRWVAVERNGKVVYQSADFELALDQAGAATADRKYPIPGHLLIRNGQIALDIRPQRLLLRTNPLDAIPQPFRSFLSLRSAPQRVWADASFHLQLAAGADGAPVITDGQGVLAVNFLNPLPLPN